MTTAVGIAAFEFKKPLDEVVVRTRRLGVTCCELATPGDLRRETIDRDRALLTNHGVVVTAVASLTKPNSVDDVAPTLALLDESVDLAAKLGCSRVITYFGGHPSRRQEEAITRYAQLVRPSVARAADQGVDILVENHFSHAPGEVTNSVDGCLDLVDAVDSPSFGINFDQCNFVIGGQDIVSAYDRLKPFIRNVHVKDTRPVDPVRDASYQGRIVTDVQNGDYLFVPVNEGITDNAAIIRRVVADQLDVPVTVEVHVTDDLIDHAFRQGVALCRAEGLR